MNRVRLRPSSRPPRRGLTLIEAVMSAMIVASVLVGTMQLTAGAARFGQALSDGATGADLADGLMAEILNKSYASPTSPTSFGRDAGETSSSKANYDDVDDYNGWTETYTFTGRTSVNDSIVATVSVARAQLMAPNADQGSESGIKRIRITVTRRNRVLAVRSAWKADAS